MNRLAEASSPYLLQHADNPVDWWEWGEDAFAEAKRRDVPVFLSVGYSSCHWCHVMAHESFEDAEVAAYLNEHFVSVKVDREERPDVDAVYMGAVQAISGRGGWPMSVFLTPDGTPFFGGTYWPKEERQGMPGFLRVIEAVSAAWTNERDKVVESGGKLAQHLREQQQVDASDERPDLTIPERAAELCVRMWDRRHGGFGQAPKFPQAMTIDFLLAHSLRTGDAEAKEAATHSLTAMSKGGIYDHVAGGFARYSVDDVWLVPHFEKMLYDNALLLRAYVHGWQATGNPRFRRIAVETAEYLLRDMRHARGAFYSATDADSEGEEGKFFLWHAEEFFDTIQDGGENPEKWMAFYGVTPAGNFSDPHHPGSPMRSILYEALERDELDDEFAARAQKVREILYAKREQRVHPGLDDKILTSWNALAIGALAEAGAAFGIPRFVVAAQQAAAFLRDEAQVHGRLMHVWKEGRGASVPAFLEDVAYLAQALLVLYEADFDPDWFRWALRLAQTAWAEFGDEETGAFYSTAHDAEELLTRPKDLWDNATPAGSSVMVDVHLRLHALTGETQWLERAEKTIAAFQYRALQAPTGYGEFLRAMERMASGPMEVAIVGQLEDEATIRLIEVYRERWRPGAVAAVNGVVGGVEAADGAASTPDVHPVALLHERPLVGGRPAAYVCRQFACERPVTSPDDLRDALDRRA
ncbi:MAG TPA: thioredoxin domain-containing protein [Egibacteraceae bacterium]|nr:thioredoxin domain-containing protein [Egibacteraceae bacterium]